jgi:hypothetical protein
MRAFVPRSLTCFLLGLLATVPGRVLAQADTASAEKPEEVTVRGRKTMTQYRLELERARDEIFRVFNEANEGTDNDVRCRKEQPTGSRMQQSVCRSNAESRATAEAGQNFLRSLFASAQGFNTFGRLGQPVPAASPVYSNIGTANAEEGGKAGQADALAQFEQEWNRLISTNRDLYRAVTTYVEIENEYARARGDAPAPQDVTVVLEETPVQTAAGPRCEASTLTEFQQRNNLARVSGTVSISMCPAGTTGAFTLVARIRDDAGEIRPIEFNETWQRADDADYVFNADYPIGDNVELVSVRVRGLTCTCAEPAQ